MGTIESFWKKKVNNLEHGGWKNEKSACKIGRHGDANRNGMARHGMDQLEAVIGSRVVIGAPSPKSPLRILRGTMFWNTHCSAGPDVSRNHLGCYEAYGHNTCDLVFKK